MLLLDHLTNLGCCLQRPFYDQAGLSSQTLKGKKLMNLQELKTQHGLMKDDIWHKTLLKIPFLRRQYYIALLKQGRKLNDVPLAHIDTIHGVKGGEADNVLLVTDMTYKPFKELERRPDNEHRVFYVGATRARKELHILLPQTDKFYG